MTKVAHVESDAVAVKTAILKYERRQPAGMRGLDPVVMLHPWFGSVRFWDRTVEALPDCETFALDLYSLGARPGWEEFATPQGLSRAVEAFADALRLERFIVIGNSMGGIAAQDLASRLDGRISKLILVGTGARIVGVKPDWRKAMDEWISGEADRSFTERMVDALLKRRPSAAMPPIELPITMNRSSRNASANASTASDRPRGVANSSQPGRAPSE